MNWVIYCRLFNRSCLLGMQFRTKSHRSSISLIFLGSLSLTLPLVGLYLYPYWSGKLDSKSFYFYFLKKRQIKQFFFPDSNFALIFRNRNFLVLVSLRESIFLQKYIRGISDRILEVGPRNESFPRNICSRGLSYVPSRLDRRAHETVYREMRKYSQDLFTHVSVAQLLV